MILILSSTQYFTFRLFYPMKKMIIKTLIILMLPSCNAQPVWKKHFDKAGKFQAAFKEEPSVYTEKNHGKDIDWHYIISEKQDKYNLSYLIRYADFPSDMITSDSSSLLQDFFLFTQFDLAKELGDHGLTHMSIKQINKYPGREFRWQDNILEKGYTIRVFLVNNRAYFLQVEYHLKNDFNNDIERFLDQFKLTDIKENPNPEKLAEKPERKFEVNFPGKTIIRDNPTFHKDLGNIYAITEAYEIPSMMKNLPQTENISYAVNYSKINREYIKYWSEKDKRDFVKKSIVDNVEGHTKGQMLLQRFVEKDNLWYFEGQGIILDGYGVLHSRSYIVDNYYYQVMVFSINGKHNNQKALDFLNSFRPK